MAHASITVTVDPLEPIALLNVSNVLDNEYWRWCADEVMDDTGRFLRDEELTYEQFEYGPDAVLPEGTTVRMEYLWGHGDLQLTKPKDYVVTLNRAAPASRVVHVLLSAYAADVEAQGATMRFYFIEQVSEKDGEIVIAWGT